MVGDDLISRGSSFPNFGAATEEAPSPLVFNQVGKKKTARQTSRISMVCKLIRGQKCTEAPIHVKT